MKYNQLFVDRIKKGKIEAFQELYMDMFPRLSSFAFNFVKDEAISDDLVQDVFLKFLENRKDINIHSSIKALMKKNILSLVAIFAFAGVFAQGIEFEHGTLEEALVKAKKENKIIFMDCYTTWCGPCKYLAKNVFTQKEVGYFFNKNFVNVKMDMESEAGKPYNG